MAGTGGPGVVLKIHVVRQGGHHYYVDDLVPGRAEVSLVAGEEPGVWVGQRPTAPSVSGDEWSRPPSPRCWRVVIRCRVVTLRNQRGRRSAAGFDLTFCAPKSVSLLHLLAPGEIASEVGAGHQAAVAGPSTTWVGRAWGSGGPGRARPRSWRRPAWWPASSSTAPVGPSIPTSIPMWWWPTWPRASTGPGRRSTAGGSSPTWARPRPSTTLGSGSSSATASERRGRCARPDSATWSASTPASGGCSRSVRPRWTSTDFDPGRARAAPPSRRRAAFHADRPEKNRIRDRGRVCGRSGDDGRRSSASTSVT